MYSAVTLSDGSRPSASTEDSDADIITYPDSEYLKLTMVYDGLTYKLYIDEVEMVSEDAVAPLSSSTSGALQIGRGSCGNYFGGEIVDLKIWGSSETLDAAPAAAPSLAPGDEELNILQKIWNFIIKSKPITVGYFFLDR